MDGDSLDVYRGKIKILDDRYGGNNSEPPDGEGTDPHGAATVRKRIDMTASIFVGFTAWRLDGDLVELATSMAGRKSTANEYFEQYLKELSAFKRDLRPDETPHSTLGSAVGSDFKIAIFNRQGPFPTDSPNEEIRATYNEVLDYEKLRKNGTRLNVFGFARLGDLVGEVEFDEAAMALKERVAKGGRDAELAKSELEQFLKYRVVVSNGDIFVVDTKDNRVTGVLRNGLNFFSKRTAVLRYATQRGLHDREDLQEPRSKVGPTSALKQSDFGAETPQSIPGGELIGPYAAWRAIAHGIEAKEEMPIILAAIGDEAGLPTTNDASFAAQGGTFSDANQDKLATLMAQLGAGKSSIIITYCHHDECWLSYNLALRLINLGYRNVKWLRVGINGWISRDLPIGPVIPYRPLP